MAWKTKCIKDVDSISSPMVSLEELLCKLIIDALEGPNEATFEVPIA